MKLRIASNLQLPIETVTQTFAILAKRGVGKTHTAVVMAEEILKSGQQLVVADPVGVWFGLRSSKDGRRAGLPIVILGGDHADVPLDVAGGQIVADLVVDERLSVILDLSRFRKGEQTRFMTDFAERLYHRNRQPIHLMMDEADAFAPQRPMKGEERMLGAVEDLVRRGRARGIGLTLITQRSAVLNKNVLSQVEVLVALRTIAPQDREAIDAWINVHGTPEQRKELMASLPSLPIGEAWFWSPGWLDLFRRVKVRDRETFDSSATPKVGQRAETPKQMAEVDLERLAERLAATIEKAKADDPQILRKRIRELESQLKGKSPVVPDPQAVSSTDESAIARAVERAMKDAARAHAEAEQAYKAHIRVLTGRLQKAAELAGRIVADASLPTPDLPPVSTSPVPKQSSRPAAERPKTAPAATNGNWQLAKGERVILTAVAQYPDGATREQLTVLTGYKRSSRDAYLQRLGAAGLVASVGGSLIATEDGLAALGPDFEPLPTGEALQRYWLDRLPAGEARILGFLIEAYPEAISREELSAKTDYKRSSRDAYLQRLCARKLVITTGPGEVQAAEVLFE